MQILKKIIVFILTVESRLIIKKYKPFIIAVTGSVGKTATKDAIFCALKTSGFVRKSEKSLNSEIGLPLTIIGVPNAWKSLSGWVNNIHAGASLIMKRKAYPDTLVLEIGADHPGDIRRVTKWLHPDIAVMTKVGDKPVHVEFFTSPTQVFEEKSFLACAVKKGGSLVLFADEPKIVKLGEKLRQKDMSVSTFGFGEESSVRGTDYLVSYEDKNGARIPLGFSFNINLNDRGELKKFPIDVKGIIGTTFMYPILAGIAVAQLKGLPIDKAIENISKYEAPKGRMNIISGINNSVIIDDTYNSSPDAVSAAIEALKSLDSTGKKIAVLGDMMELGSYSAGEHRNIGKIIQYSASVLVTVGPRATAIADEAVINGMSKEKVFSYSSSIEAGEAISKIVGAGDVVLIKGSQSVRMERITKMLMADPSQAEKLLVRQEKEWLDKA